MGTDVYGPSFFDVLERFEMIAPKAVLLARATRQSG
jgi:hypothetical protein